MGEPTPADGVTAVVGGPDILGDMLVVVVVGGPYPFTSRVASLLFPATSVAVTRTTTWLDVPTAKRTPDFEPAGSCIYRYLAGGNIEAEYHEEIYRLTILDGLTQIHNQRYMSEFLEREVVRSQRHARPLALLMIDLDRFKAINDTFGHLCGDFVLREMTDVIRATVRKEDLFARYGGEEFVLVLVETGPEEAVLVAERIRQAVADHPFQFESTPVKLTISIGIACMAGEMEVTPAGLLKTADEHLYQAKRSGRNRVVTQGTESIPEVR